MTKRRNPLFTSDCVEGIKGGFLVVTSEKIVLGIIFIILRWETDKIELEGLEGNPTIGEEL